PDTYQGSEGHITAMLAGINKKVAFLAAIYVLFLVFLNFKTYFVPVLEVLSIATMFFGNMVALVQKNVKRMFAYSSISQAGYITIGLATASRYGISASIYQIFGHMFMIIAVFGMIEWFEKEGLYTIGDYRGLIGRSRMPAVALTIIILSLIGIPPFIGF
ncbi:proton-translocating NADH-quinone oxidoreductase, chain N, partial [mine drainage metagenome]